MSDMCCPTCGSNETGCCAPKDGVDFVRRKLPPGSSYPPHVQAVLDVCLEWIEQYGELCPKPEVEEFVATDIDAKLYEAVKSYKERSAPPTQDKEQS